MKIGLALEQRKNITDRLQVALATLFVLFVKQYKYHWNVKGQHFGSLHELFQKGYEMLYEEIDEIAERIQQLGFPAHGTMHEFLQESLIKESFENPSAQTMIKVLVESHEQVICLLRDLADYAEEQCDMGTNDFLIGLMQKHEKYAWLLRSHCE